MWLQIIRMSHSQDWDVNKYRSPYEPSHHWELKKKFMEHHKDRFPEEALESRKFTHISKKYWFIFQVGLAQTFGNMEFMGCQYPQVTRSCLRLFRNANIFCFRRHRRESMS